MRNLMIYGTGSEIGKHVVACAFIRNFVQDGYNVAPFKGFGLETHGVRLQDQTEMALAQVIQALAAKRTPDPIMSPILYLYDQLTETMHYVIRGERTIDIPEDRLQKIMMYSSIISDSIALLTSDVDFLVIEGSGNPSEPGYQQFSLNDTGIADLADAKVILVSNLKYTGAFAAAYGTLELLDVADRDRVIGIILNEADGELKYIWDSCEIFTKETGYPVLGVIPHIKGLKVWGESPAWPSDFSRLKVLEAEFDALAKVVRASIRDWPGIYDSLRN